MIEFLIGGSILIMPLKNYGVLKGKAYLSGSIGAGETLRITLSGKDVQLSNKGGIITLLDRKGLKVDGVSYTKKEASGSGWTMVF